MFIFDKNWKYLQQSVAMATHRKPTINRDQRRVIPTNRRQKNEKKIEKQNDAKQWKNGKRTRAVNGLEFAKQFELMVSCGSKWIFHTLFFLLLPPSMTMDFMRRARAMYRSSKMLKFILFLNTIPKRINPDLCVCLLPHVLIFIIFLLFLATLCG